MPSPCRTLILATIVLLTSTPIHAALVLDLRLDDGTRARTLNAGSSAFLDLFLVDTDGTSPMSTDGLLNGGARILETNTLGTAATGMFSTPGAGFLVSPLPTAAAPGIAAGRVLAFSAVAAVSPGPGVTSAAMAGAMEVMIGRFQVTANGPAGNVSTLTADIFGGADIGNTTGGPSLLPLDALLTASEAAESVSLTVSAAAVPEPSTFLVAALLACAGGVFWMRRRGTFPSDSGSFAA
ncbi:MAG: hypothetical protein R3C59_24695 [Planctomycetaceae bacterium]